MDLMDLHAFRERYPAWLEANRPLLEAGNWHDSFKGYPFPINAESPWAPLDKPLSRCRLAVLTTAGLYIAGEQPPFRAADIEGDWTFRELPDGTPYDRLAIAHDHYPHALAEEDLNVVYPLERLAELVNAGALGELAPRHISISGYCTRPDLVVEHSAGAIVETLRRDAVDVLLHLPV
jgi:D-proline reductase (dithiol) PrdB